MPISNSIKIHHSDHISQESQVSRIEDRQTNRQCCLIDSIGYIVGFVCLYYRDRIKTKKIWSKLYSPHPSMVATRESCREGESSWKSGALNFFQPLFPFFLEKWISYKTLTFFSLVFLFGNCDWRKTWCWRNGKSQMKNISNATYKIPALWLHTKIWMFLNNMIFSKW